MIKRGLALFALLFIIVVYIVYPLSYSAIEPDIEEQLSPYGEDYNDLSEFKNDLENVEDRDEDGNKIGDKYDIYSIVASPTILNGPDVEPEDSLYVAVGMEKKYSDDQINALLEFLRLGGKAILADDYGYLSEFARYFRVTYYQGKFFDNEFDRNENFTVVYPKLSVDQYTPYLPDETDILLNETNTLALNNLRDTPPRDDDGNELDLKWYDKDIPLPDGIWDSDQDGDGRIDEDPPEKGTPIDDDMDKAKSANDGLDNDHDTLIDEEDPNEGLNEDPLDDDGDWIDLNRNGKQEPMIWHDKDGDGLFGYLDNPNNPNGYFDAKDSFEFYDDRGNLISEYISGDYGVDEEFYDGIDNDGDTIIDEDLKGYRILFNDATGMTSQGNRIIANGGTSDPPSYVNLDSRPGANPPSVGDEFSPDELVDEISSPGSEIQLIIEVLICKECGGAVDIRTGNCLDTTSEIKVKDPCHAHYEPEEYSELGRAIFISDSSLFLNDIYTLDHLATDDDTGEPYLLNDEGEPAQNIPFTEWDNAPVSGVSDRDKSEAQIEDETRRNYVVDQTADGELDYDNKKFAKDLIKYLLPDGGMIVFDESRHYQENEFLIPVYSTIHVVTFLTSDPWYSSAMIVIFVLLLTFTIGVVRNKENWVHRHNINILNPRRVLPSAREDQLERVRWAILSKARLSRGLSPEEFQALSPNEVNNMIKDQQLIDIVRNPNKAVTDEEISMIMHKLSTDK
jgi:hypothetical protein